MPVSTPPTVAFGDPVLASGFDALLQAADERLERLYSGSRSWLAFDTTSVPTQQIPRWGAIYVLSNDADRRLIPSAGSAGCPHGGLWPAKYDHAAHVAAADAMTLVGPDSLGVAWIVSGGFVVDVYGFGDSASILQRNVFGVTKPLKLDSAYEPERFHRYALADVLIESFSTDHFSWAFDKYGVVRIHNLSRFSVTVALSGGSSISIAPRRIRTIRKETRTGAWDTTLRRFLPKCLPGDIPMWDSETSEMANLPLRSQAANPIFRQVMLQEMFQPWALTDDPGMFSSTILPVLPSASGTIASAIVQNGSFDSVKTGPSISGHALTSLSYSGENFSSTPIAWVAAGVSVSLDVASRGAVVSVDPGEEPGTQIDVISRSTNVTGEVVSGLPMTFLPWFSNATAADTWYSSLFLWPTYGYVRTPTEEEWGSGSVFTPSGGGADPDYYGSWSAGTPVAVREYQIEFGSGSFGSVPAWNIFSTSINSALPPGGSLVRQVILTAVTANVTETFWADREDATWDDAGPVLPRSSGGVRGIRVGGEVWGLGDADGDAFVEPRWRIALFPTTGSDSFTQWSCFGFYGAEEIIWTPLVPSPVLGPASGQRDTLSHWRVVSAEGAEDGAAWSWSYANEDTVSSGMRFWRQFSIYQRQPGEFYRYQGRPRTGPQPWPIRDHGLSADLALAANTWAASRGLVRDSSPVLPDERYVGFQIRMTAPAFNQMSALIAGMDFVRPCGWEEYVDGFSFSELLPVADGKWGGLAPIGACHVRGVASSVDSKLDSIGAAYNTASNSTLQGYQSAEYREYVPFFNFISGALECWSDEPLGTSSDPAILADFLGPVGDPLQYYTPDDIQEALAAEGFSFGAVFLVCPVRTELYVPGSGIETQADTFTSSGGDPIGSGRLLISETSVVPVHDPSGELQLYQTPPAFPKITPETPFRASVVVRCPSYDAAGNPPIYPPHTGLSPAIGADRSVNLVGPSTGPEAFAVAADPYRSVVVVAHSGLDVRVVCTPERRFVTPDIGLGATGPETLLASDDLRNSGLTIPDADARPKIFTRSGGEQITLTDLTGSETPAIPSKAHTWTLHPLDTTVEVM